MPVDNRLFRKIPNWLTPNERRVLGMVSRDANWQEGRQATGYEKLDLINQAPVAWIIERALDNLGNPYRYDAWLLHYPVGSEIPEHTDPAQDDLCHVRLNALITAGAGGVLYLDSEEMLLDEGDGYLFRPDAVPHKVTPVEDSSRLVFSVGANVELEQARSLGLA